MRHFLFFPYEKVHERLINHVDDLLMGSQSFSESTSGINPESTIASMSSPPDVSLLGSKGED